ncbi:MAG: DUF819 family protein [Flavobacteriales bacterium]|nr:DUF819 family protein [Flavobacteriales bacterium]
MKTFKSRPRPPLVKNDAAVFGLLLVVLYFIFKTARSENSALKKFYKIVPALLLCYFIPAGLNSVGIVYSEESNLYFVASRYLLPASLVLLCLSIDLPSIKKLGSKAIIMFFAATIGIVIGGPIALWLVSLMAPEVLDGEIWKGLSTVAGSWIGGGANQTAMKEIYGASDQLFSAMIVVDVFVANVFMSILLFGTGYNKKLNKFFKADDSAIEGLKNKMEKFQASVAKIPTFYDLIKMMGITFFCVGLAHFLSDLIAPVIGDGLNSLRSVPAGEDMVVVGDQSPTWGDHAADLMVSFGSGFFWLVVLSTVFGIILSFTKYRSLEGAGASKFGSLFLYVLVATIGMKMDIMELVANWGVFKFLITIGLIWIVIHALVLFIVAKIIKAPFFYVAVGSQANVGGAASAPIVASAFSPSLAPVGVLLAVLGYAVGTFGAILCTLLMQSLTL